MAPRHPPRHPGPIRDDQPLGGPSSWAGSTTSWRWRRSASGAMVAMSPAIPNPKKSSELIRQGTTKSRARSGSVNTTNRRFSTITRATTVRSALIDPEEIDWDGPEDPTNPQNWSVRRKWAITVILSVMTVNVTFASSAPSAATRLVAADMGVSVEVADLITSMFLVGYVLGPIFWGPGSELVGRRNVFVFAMSMYTILHLGQALAQNIQTMLISRFLGGFFAVAPLVNGGGLIADIWNAEQRAKAMSLFTAAVFLGPGTVGLISVILVNEVSWRWVFWVMMMFGGVCTVIMILTLPETYAPVILLKKADPVGNKGIFAAAEKQDWSLQGVIKRTLYRPFEMLASEPILVLITAYLSLIYGVLYGLFQAVPIIFVRKRDFTIAQSGLIFIGVGIGTSLGSALNVWLLRNDPQLIRNASTGAMVGGCAFVIGIFWLGCVPWYVPALSTIVVGMSVCMIFISCLSYLVETYLMYSASAFAANTFVRSLVAASFPLFTVQFFTNVGVNWATTILGGVGLLLLPSPFLFYKYGSRIRGNSKFAPCLDLKIAAVLAQETEMKPLGDGKISLSQENVVQPRRISLGNSPPDASGKKGGSAV
ncbi:major facilitator superfamily domain-containing protein [Mycena olivaceomarginata]|nr:major facilitator superfamily domain-containing protein [Mycena olivaceomarginata]